MNILDSMLFGNKIAGLSFHFCDRVSELVRHIAKASIKCIIIDAQSASPASDGADWDCDGADWGCVGDGWHCDGDGQDAQTSNSYSQSGWASRADEGA